MAEIVFENVSKHFGQTRVIDQLNLTIPGEWEQDSDTVYFNRAADLTASNYHTAGQRNLMVQLGVLE